MTEHFKLFEFIPDWWSQPVPAEVEANLRKLCETCLEPARVALDYPIRVTSGWRPPAQNARTVGASQTSDHMYGRAADIQALSDGDMDPERIFELFDWLRENAPVGQLILEDHRIARKNSGKLWVHCAIPSPKHPGKNDPNRLLVSSNIGVYRKWESIA